MNPSLRRSILLSAGLLMAGSVGARQVTGLVTNLDSGGPVAGAVVFVDRTTILANTDADGLFRLATPPQTTYTIVVVADGFATGSRRVSPTERTEEIDVPLEPKPTGAAPPTSPDGRDDLLHLLRDALFTWSGYGRKCVIENPDVLRVTAGQHEFELTATATEPVVITNRALGYRMTWYDFSFAGTPINPNWQGRVVFEELSGSGHEADDWRDNRRFAYRASFRHFLWTLAHDRLNKEFFTAYHVQEPGQVERSNAIAEMKRSGFSANRLMPVLRDGYEEGTRQLTFNGWLYVVNRFGIEFDRRYVERYMAPTPIRDQLLKAHGDPASWILLTYATVTVDPTGVVLEYPDQDKVIALGDMGMRRVDFMLPIDYVPE